MAGTFPLVQCVVNEFECDFIKAQRGKVCDSTATTTTAECEDVKIRKIHENSFLNVLTLPWSFSPLFPLISSHIACMEQHNVQEIGKLHTQTRNSIWWCSTAYPETLALFLCCFSVLCPRGEKRSRKTPECDDCVICNENETNFRMRNLKFLLVFLS